jgi:hypothetical protein
MRRSSLTVVQGAVGYAILAAIEDLNRDLKETL